MKDLLLYIARNLVDDPDSVSVTEVQGDQELTLELRVAPDDMGKELGTFIPAFMEEGQIGGRQAILPLAKSTEVLFVNRALFDRWAATSGASYDDLTTWEGIYALAERYAADTGPWTTPGRTM